MLLVRLAQQRGSVVAREVVLVEVEVNLSLIVGAPGELPPGLQVPVLVVQQLLLLLAWLSWRSLVSAGGWSAPAR